MLLTEFVVLVKEKLRKLRFTRCQACSLLYYVHYQGRAQSGCSRSFILAECAPGASLCFNSHTRNLRSDDTEMQLDIVEAETGSV